MTGDMRLEQAVLYSAQQYNILPLTSGCNIRCLFCSHRQNPEGVQVFTMPPRRLQEVETTLEFLDPGKKIVIGESATKIIEGEPFSHPQIWEILSLVRRKMPATPLTITTNGCLLDGNRIDYLTQLQPLELNLSLNSATPTGRRLLMGDNSLTGIKEVLTLLGSAGLNYHGSLVAMPWIVGWHDIRETVFHLAENRAKTVRVFLPGYTKLAPPELRFSRELLTRLEEFISRLRDETEVPVILEPSLVTELTAEVLGVIAGSPAARTGIKRGDCIKAVNGRTVFSRADAYHVILQAANPRLDINRSGSEITLEINKQPGEASGLVFAYDLPRSQFDELASEVEKLGSGSAVIFTSTWGFPLLSRVVRLIPGSERVDVVSVENRFFGGSINSAGLLTVGDFNIALSSWKKDHPCPDLILLPAIAFDLWGRDITGRGYWEISAAVDQIKLV